MTLGYFQARLVSGCISVSRDLQLPRSFIITKAIKHVLETGEVKVRVNDLIVTDESQQQQEEVSNILNDDNPNNDQSACDELGAFINQVNAAERRDTLTAEQADVLRTQAEDIRNNLNC
jgi:hypothetical protein